MGTAPVGILGCGLLAFEGGGGVGERGGGVTQRVGPDSLSDISSRSESAFSDLGFLDLTLAFFSLDVLALLGSLDAAPSETESLSTD